MPNNFRIFLYSKCVDFSNVCCFGPVLPWVAGKKFARFPYQYRVLMGGILPLIHWGGGSPVGRRQ